MNTNIDVNSLNSNQKKRLLQQLYDDEQYNVKKKNYELKYPSFKQTICDFENAISELQENMKKNNILIQTLNNNIKKTELSNDLKNIINKNNNIYNSIKTLENHIINIKKDFSNICIHQWITETKYYNISNIETDKLNEYEICDESDITQIKNIINNSNEKNKEIISQDWGKIKTNKKFYDYNPYDRETYYICETCNHHHTIHFYSK